MTLLTRSEEIRGIRLARSGRAGAAALHRLVNQVRRRVIKFVKEQSEANAYLSGRRARVLGVDAHVAEAGLGRLLAPRHAEVAIYDYDRDVLVSVIVDLKKARVERITELPGRQPPPTKVEMKAATELVRSAVKKGALVRREAVVSSAREATIEGHPAYGHRVFEVRFIDQKGRASQPLLADLSREACLKPKRG